MTSTMNNLQFFSDSFLVECEKRIDELKTKAAQVPLDAEEAGQVYPALQLDNYQPKVNETPQWCFGKDSYDLLPDHVRLQLSGKKAELESKELWFNEKQTEPAVCYFPSVSMRFIPLVMPQKGFVFNKVTGSVEKNSGSEWGKETRSVAKLFLAVLVNDNLLLDDEGLPMVFTLKLKSFNVSMVIGKDATAGTLKGLNSELVKRKMGNGKSLLHFVNLDITPASHLFESKDKTQKSRGATYQLSNAKLNTSENIDLLNELLASKTFLTQISDPFGLKKKDTTPVEETPESSVLEYEVDPITGEVISEEIPY